MATTYGNQYQLVKNVPSEKIAMGEQGGHRRMMYFDYTAPGTPPSLNDIIEIGVLPKGARVVDVCLAFPDMGTGGLLDVGYAASVETDGNDGISGTPLEAAAPVAFFSALDIKTAAAIKLMSGVSGAAAAGFLKKLAAAVVVQIKVNEAWTATSGTIKGYVEYIID